MKLKHLRGAVGALVVAASGKIYTLRGAVGALVVAASGKIKRPRREAWEDLGAQR